MSLLSAACSELAGVGQLQAPVGRGGTIHGYPTGRSTECTCTCVIEERSWPGCIRLLHISCSSVTAVAVAFAQKLFIGCCSLFNAWVVCGCPVVLPVVGLVQWLDSGVGCLGTSVGNPRGRRVEGKGRGLWQRDTVREKEEPLGDFSPPERVPARYGASNGVREVLTLSPRPRQAQGPGHQPRLLRGGEAVRGGRGRRADPAPRRAAVKAPRGGPGGTALPLPAPTGPS